MELSPVNNLVELLRSPSLRVRIGIWLMPLIYLGRETDEAAKQLLEPIDMCQIWLKTIPERSNFIGLTPKKFLIRLDAIAQKVDSNDCALVYNADFFLAHFKQVERQSVWEYLYDAMPHRPRALLISLPETALNLLPSIESLNHWSRENRIAGISNAF